MKTEKIKTARFAALDVLIAVLLLLCVVGVAIRTAIGESGLFRGDNKGTYLVSYTVKAVSSDYNEYFKDGESFFLEDGEKMGTITGQTVSVPTRVYSENSKGELVSNLETDGTVDIKGTVKVKGTMTKSGFLLNSGTYIAPNMTLSVRNSAVSVELIITDIVKAG
ncbi:MAG: DUF4330 family protein [Ruminococcaceae bacterium]|nr:DUF4330 family protein [Oscillospiraceae bacterium]